MNVGELKEVLERVPSYVQVLTGEEASEITDAFLTITKAYRLIDFEAHNDALVLIEKGAEL